MMVTRKRVEKLGVCVGVMALELGDGSRWWIHKCEAVVLKLYSTVNL